MLWANDKDGRSRLGGRMKTTPQAGSCNGSAELRPGREPNGPLSAALTQLFLKKICKSALTWQDGEAIEYRQYGRFKKHDGWHDRHIRRRCPRDRVRQYRASAAASGARL